MIPSYINGNKSTSLNAVLHFFCHTFRFLLYSNTGSNWKRELSYTNTLYIYVCMYECVLRLILAGNTIPRENFEECTTCLVSQSFSDEWQLSGPMAELTGHSQLGRYIPPFEGKRLKRSIFLSFYFVFSFFKSVLSTKQRTNRS